MEPLGRRGARFTKIIVEIFRLNRLLLDAGDRLTAPVGLTSARWQVISVVDEHPAPVAEVARAMGLTRQSVQQTANGLARDGLIEWVENPLHRRAKLIRITPKGRKALDAVAAEHTVWANAVGRAQDRRALKASLAYLRALRATLDTADSL